jgi:alkanesulfonate monooxygenase SsuD/methylene tetrahydromethanopterin reductase-like flavin-dependent oxidoreductase (luciferase family)
MEPKPLQKPHPPIWLGGNSSKSLELTAELADGWYSRHVSPEKLKECIEFIKRNAKKSNMEYATTFEWLQMKDLGDADRVINEINRYSEAGATLITITFTKLEDLEYFAKNILKSI